MHNDFDVLTDEAPRPRIQSDSAVPELPLMPKPRPLAMPIQEIGPKPFSLWLLRSPMHRPLRSDRR